jgi:hypothetical protein
LFYPLEEEVAKNHITQSEGLSPKTFPEALHTQETGAWKEYGVSFTQTISQQVFL